MFWGKNVLLYNFPMTSLSLSEETTILLAIVIGVLLVVAFGIIAYFNFRLKRILRGKNTKTLEGSLSNMQKDIDQLLENKKKVTQVIGGLDRRVSKSIQGVGTVRFNPFQGTSGSNQSFVTAFLNENGDGVVFSSLYSRERVSMFAKPIKNNDSEYTLTEEERAALKQAQENSKKEDQH